MSSFDEDQWQKHIKLADMIFKIIKHERWDTVTFHRLMTNVRDFCV